MSRTPSIRPQPPSTPSPTMPRRPRAKTARRAVVLAATAGLLLGGCTAEVAELAQDTIDEAREDVQLVQFCLAAARVAQALDGNDMDSAVAAGQDMVAHAPIEVRPQAELLLDAARDAQAGDPSTLSSPQGRDAAEHVARFTADRCDPR